MLALQHREVRDWRAAPARALIERMARARALRMLKAGVLLPAGLSMAAAIKAGAAYFTIVFLAGFALGTFRVLVVAPRLGATIAVLLEAPVILAVSWGACRWCVRRLRPPATASARASMGAAAFALLMSTELGLSVLVFGRSLVDHFASYGTTAGAIGLAAQIGFALLPLAQRPWTAAPRVHR
jgi:hypothetical protein